MHSFVDFMGKINFYLYSVHIIYLVYYIHEHLHNKTNNNKIRHESKELHMDVDVDEKWNEQEKKNVKNVKTVLDDKMVVNLQVKRRCKIIRWISNFSSAGQQLFWVLMPAILNTKIHIFRLFEMDIRGALMSICRFMYWFQKRCFGFGVYCDWGVSDRFTGTKISFNCFIFPSCLLLRCV